MFFEQGNTHHHTYFAQELGGLEKNDKENLVQFKKKTHTWIFFYVGHL